MSHEKPVYPTPAAPLAAAPEAPAGLSERERVPYLAAIQHGRPALGDWNYPDMLKRLLARYDASHAEAADLRRELTEARAAHAAAVAAHRVEVLDILRDLRLPMLPLPDPDLEDRSPNPDWHFAHGQNKERAAINLYCNQKAYEYSPEGIGPDPVKVGEWDTLPAAGAGKEGGAAK